MAEKVNIYITKEVHSILLKDMELFEFTKKNGDLNRNLFLNTLIANYTTEYEETKSQTYNGIRSLLETKTNLPSYEIGDLSNQVLRLIDDTTQSLQHAKTNVTLPLKPTRVSQSQYERIKKTLLANDTESNYFRQLFTSYTKLPQNTREKIIFKDVVEKLEQAIQEEKKVCLFFSNGKVQDVSPYTLCSSKEELFNYLLYQDNHKQVQTRRLTRITNVMILNEVSSFTNENQEHLQWLSENSPQFASKPLEVKVLLTDKGKELVKRIYIHRPKRIKHDCNDGYYYFETTKEQALHYFPKLGKHAVILEPESLAISIYKKLNETSRAYWYHHKQALQKEKAK
jgi:hypothetical protein